MIKGTELFVKALKEEGVDTLFGYPGGQAIDLFDALYDQDDIEVILPRHEQALIHADSRFIRRHFWQLQLFYQAVHSSDTDVYAIITLKNIGNFVSAKPFVVISIDMKN